MNGSVNPNNSDTDFWFEFGTTTSLGKKTTVQSIGGGSAWQTVAGNLSGLEPGRVYYYRVVAQNKSGKGTGGIMSFTTLALGTKPSTIGGEVLGLSTIDNTFVAEGQDSPRPSFMSLEYSLRDDGPVVLVANDIRPKSGENFSYTIVYKNDTKSSYNEANLKVIIPSEATYSNSSVQPLTTSSNIVVFDLGNIQPGQQGAVVIEVKINEGVAAETNLIFTTVLGYKTPEGVQLASTTYMTLKTGETVSKASASFWSSLIGSSSILWLVAFSLVILLGVLIYAVLKMRRRKEEQESAVLMDEEKIEPEPEPEIPPTFQPIDEFHLGLDK
jgi:hypothetical protein